MNTRPSSWYSSWTFHLEKLESSYPVPQRHIPEEWNPVTQWHSAILQQNGVQLHGDTTPYPSRMESCYQVTQRHIPAEMNPVTQWQNVVSHQNGVQLPNGTTPYPSSIESSYPMTERHIPTEWNQVTQWYIAISQQKGVLFSSSLLPTRHNLFCMRLLICSFFPNLLSLTYFPLLMPYLSS